MIWTGPGLGSGRAGLSDAHWGRYRPASWSRAAVIRIGFADKLAGCAGKLVDFAPGRTVGCAGDMAALAGCGVSQPCSDMHLKIVVVEVLKSCSHGCSGVSDSCGKLAVSPQCRLGCRRYGSQLRGAPALLAAAGIENPCWLRRRGTGRVSPQRVLMNPR